MKRLLRLCINRKSSRELLSISEALLGGFDHRVGHFRPPAWWTSSPTPGSSETEVFLLDIVYWVADAMIRPLGLPLNPLECGNAGIRCIVFEPMAWKTARFRSAQPVLIDQLKPYTNTDKWSDPLIHSDKWSNPNRA